MSRQTLKKSITKKDGMTCWGSYRDYLRSNTTMTTMKDGDRNSTELIRQLTW